MKWGHLDLFSGIGGFALAVRWAGGETIGFCERDKFCQRVLARHWPGVPCHGDIKGLNGREYAGRVQLLTGGFPCQPFSLAGQRRGEADDRYLWSEMFRVIKEARPRWILAENVPGIISVALDTVLADLESEDYETGTVVIPACAQNAPHRRDRVWIVANAEEQSDRTGLCKGRQGEKRRQRSCDRSRPLANPHQSGLEGRDSGGMPECSSECPAWESGPSENGRFTLWESEPDVGRVAHGVPDWLDEPVPRTCTSQKHRRQRLTGLGNAIVPQVAYRILKGMNL